MREVSGVSREDLTKKSKSWTVATLVGDKCSHHYSFPSSPIFHSTKLFQAAFRHSTYLTIWIHLKPNPCTLQRSQSTLFRKLLFTSVLNYRTKRSSSKKLVMERCSDQTMKGEKRIYYKKLKVYDVWETSAKIPCWWRVTSQIWVVFLIGRAAQEICFNQSETLPRTSALVS